MRNADLVVDFESRKRGNNAARSLRLDCLVRDGTELETSNEDVGSIKGH